MTAKEALKQLSPIRWEEKDIKAAEILNQALTELEAIKSADDSVVLVGLVKLLHNYLFRADDLIIINNIKNYILKAQAQEQELRELKEKIRNLAGNHILSKIEEVFGENNSLVNKIDELLNLCKGSEE